MNSELKYIWIKEFRVLKNIGFNFNHLGKHKFEYTKEVLNLLPPFSNKLDFGDKISSITAIAGQNASGKSSLCETIIEAVATLTNGSLGYNYNFNGIVVFGDHIFINEKIKVGNLKSLMKNGYQIVEFKESPFESMRADIRAEFEKIGFIYYSNLFDKRAENKANNLFNISSYNLLKADKYYSQYYLDEAQSLRSGISPYNDKKSESEIHEYEESFRFINYYLSDVTNMHIAAPFSFFILPTYFGNNRKLDFRQIEVDFEDKNYLENLAEEILSPIGYKYVNSQDYAKIINLTKATIANICFNIYKLNLICQVFVKIKTLGDKAEIYNFIFFDKLPDTIFEDKDLITALLSDFWKICKQGSFETEFSPDRYANILYPEAYDWRFYLVCWFRIKNTETNRRVIASLIQNENKLFHNNQNISGRICDYFMSPNPSSGESSYYSLFSRLYKILSSPQDDRNLHLSYIVFIDEGEVGFHPAWKKKYLTWLINFFNNQFHQYKIQLILTTHNPYLLSDLPPENCILMQRNQSGHPNQVAESDVKSFGANIHELLATSFFLEDGLIGDFAKVTIQKVINFLNDWRIQKNLISERDKEFVKYVISIVSDEIVKFKLLEMYSEIFQNDTLIEEEILKLQIRIETLKNNGL